MKGRSTSLRGDKVCAPRSGYYKTPSSHVFTSRVVVNPRGVDFYGRPVTPGPPVMICSWCGKERP